MQTVEDDSGRRYLRLKRSGDASLVRDPETGEETYVENESLEPVDRSPLETAATGIPGSTLRVLTAVRDERSLGLLLEIDARGPLAVRTLLDAYDLCESDLHGLLGEFRAAGLLEEARVNGERGYDTTTVTSDALGRLRD